MIINTDTVLHLYTCSHKQYVNLNSFNSNIRLVRDTYSILSLQLDTVIGV